MRRLAQRAQGGLAEGVIRQLKRVRAAGYAPLTHPTLYSPTKCSTMASNYV